MVELLDLAAQLFLQLRLEPAAPQAHLPLPATFPQLGGSGCRPRARPGSPLALAGPSPPSGAPASCRGRNPPADSGTGSRQKRDCKSQGEYPSGDHDALILAVTALVVRPSTQARLLAGPADPTAEARFSTRPEIDSPYLPRGQFRRVTDMQGNTLPAHLLRQEGSRMRSCHPRRESALRRVDVSFRQACEY